MVITYKSLAQFICCDGRAKLSIWNRTPLLIKWADSEGNNSGEFNVSNQPLSKHPFTWTVHSEPRKGYRRFNAELRTASGEQDGSTTNPILSEPSLQILPGWCLPVNKFYIYISMNFGSYVYSAFSTSWDRPPNINTGGVAGGGGWIEFYDSRNTLIRRQDFDGNVGRGLYKIRLNAIQETDANHTSNSLCDQETFCILEIKDKDNNVVNTVETPLGLTCPNAWQEGCSIEDNEQTTYYDLVSYTYYSNVGDTHTRTQYVDCIEVFNVVDDQLGNGLVVYQVRYFSNQITIDPFVNRPIKIILEEWEERELVGYKWSPKGCPAPFFILNCNPEPVEPEKCPDGTAYECIREDGHKCCYDCNGDIIAII